MTDTTQESSKPDFANLSIPLPGWYKKWLEYCWHYDRLQCMLLHAFVGSVVFNVFFWGVISIITGQAHG